MRFTVLLVLLWALSAIDLHAATLTVDCDRGETIARALARISLLDGWQANTVNVRGTCVESVEIRNFERLTLAGIGPAAIRGTSDASPELSIANSQDVIVRDLTIGSSAGTSLQISNCQDCEVRGSMIEGLTLLYGSGTTLFFDDVLHANGSFAALGSYDHIRVIMVDCTVEPGSGWIWAGVNSESILHMSGSTVRGFGVGIAVNNGAKLTLSDRQSLVPGSGPDATVVVENNAWAGIEVSGASTASIPAARIRNNAVGVVASGNSRLLTGSEEGFGPGAEISDNMNVGVMVRDGAHADIGTGTRIIRTAGNGLVVVNNSTAAGPPSAAAPATRIDGSTAQDVFCDATSIVSNAARIAAPKMTCPNLNTGPHVPLPTQ